MFFKSSLYSFNKDIESHTKDLLWTRSAARVWNIIQLLQCYCSAHRSLCEFVIRTTLTEAPGCCWLIRRVTQRLDLIKASCQCWCSLSRSCFLVHLLPSCLSQGRRWWNEALTRDRVIHLLFRLLAEACLPSCCRHCYCCCSCWRHW